jgi:hypothetical protein
MHFVNSDDSHLYQAAEDAFTSEGGHLARNDKGLDTRTGPIRIGRQPSRNFRKTARRFAAAMRAVMRIFRADVSRRASRSVFSLRSAEIWGVNPVAKYRRLARAKVSGTALRKSGHDGRDIG